MGLIMRLYGVRWWIVNMVASGGAGVLIGFKYLMGSAYGSLSKLVGTLFRDIYPLQ